MCITSEQLTEQWKKGELPNGYYWIRLSWGGMVIMAYHTAFDGLFELDDHYYDSDEISEVLAPVPSYDEWQATETSIAYNELLEENTKLKELLRKCRPALVRFVSYDDSEENARILLMNEINEVLK